MNMFKKLMAGVAALGLASQAPAQIAVQVVDPAGPTSGAVGGTPPLAGTYMLCRGNGVTPATVSSGQGQYVWCTGYGGLAVTPADNSGFLAGTSTAGTSDSLTLSRGLLFYNVQELVGNTGLTVGTRARDLIGAQTGTTGAGIAAVGMVPSASASEAIAPSNGGSGGGNTSVKGSAGNLFALNAVMGASAGFVIVYNAASITNGATLTAANIAWAMPLTASQGIDKTFNPPMYLSAGEQLLCSTSLATFTSTPCTQLEGQGL